MARRNGKVFITGNSGFPKSLDISKAIDKAAGVEFAAVPASGVGFMNADGAGGYNVTKNRLVRKGASSAAAKQWQGWGTALKPALEPITVARKPLGEKTVAANVLAHGTGALNIDGCRVAAPGETIENHARSGNAEVLFGADKAQETHQSAGQALGRWPANLIHDGSDEVISVFPADGSGSAARFFYSPKVGKEEREFGMGEFDASSAGEVTSRKDGSQGLNSPRAGAGRTTGSRNVHPTVKPVDLMRYLCRLVTPPGGIVLDPFAGSGTTGIAATIEKFRAILIEREDQYSEICRARVGAAKPMGNGDLWESVASVSGKGR